MRDYFPSLFIIFFGLFLGLFLGCHAAVLRPKSALHQEKSLPPAVIHFDSEQWEISPAQISQVQKLAKGLEKQALLVEGHTDFRGTQEYNLRLGDRRARRVQLELVRCGIQPNHLTLLSYGEKRPQRLGRSREDLKANRRVEIRLRH